MEIIDRRVNKTAHYSFSPDVVAHGGKPNIIARAYKSGWLSCDILASTVMSEG